MSSRRTPANDRLPPPTASEAKFERLLATFDDPTPPPADLPLEARAFLNDLYANRERYLSTEPYANIGDSDGFNTKVVGVTFEGRQDVVAGLHPGAVLAVERDPANAFDANAIAVRFGSLQIGYLKREIAAKIAPNIDGGDRYRAEIKHITGGGTRSVGVNIWVSRDRALNLEPARPGALRAGSGEVLAALIGDRPIREAQRLVLERVDAGRNTLAIFGTGRGKSFCFQYPAAVRALERGQKTVVLYPLRALANDQYEALVRRLEPLGLRILRANGAIESNERAALMDALESGEWDIICSTPEFLSFHLDRFNQARSRPSLLVVDEAHHLFESKHRPAYMQIGAAIERLGSPSVLALTATANDDVFARIRDTLGIESWVIDPTVRENLHVVEARGTTNKLAYIERFLAGDGKAIVYCNSRSEATKVAEKLRVSVGEGVAFYHAGVASAERAQVERFFRSGAIRVVVATSAFGEGIDLPDVRNVFLYHLNFDFTEFNQQAGRAGRDGAPASIHLLFGEKDRRLNDFIIERSSPTLHTLRNVYRAMKGIASDGVVRMTYADIATTLDFDKVDQRTIATAVRIFADSQLVALEEDDDGRLIRFLAVDGKVDLTQNARFAEGEAERESFQRFCEVVSTAEPNVLEAVINRPIYPAEIPLVR